MKNKKLRSVWNNVIYLWSNGYLKTIPDSISNQISHKKTYGKLAMILKDFLADFLRLFKKNKIPKNKIWFLVFSKNNIDALDNIKHEINNSIYVTFFRFRSNLNIQVHYFYLPFRFFYDLIFPINLARYYFKNKNKALSYYDLLFTINGSYEECLRLLKKNNPEALVFSNDHMVIPRALILAGNELGIKTYYIQHASITSYFPPLEFTYSLLEGDDAFHKYKECGSINSKVFLVGMPKFDYYSNDINQNIKLTSIGVAYNPIDDIALVHDFLLKLRHLNPDIIIIARPHPSDLRILPITKDIDIKISDSKNESAFEFLKRIDCLVSGESSIHLEAVLLNVYPCYFNFANTKNRFDYYSYIENGLVENFENFKQLNYKIQELKNYKPNIQYRARYYNASIGEEFYGKSSKRCAEIILETLKEN